LNEWTLIEREKERSKFP